MMINVEILQAVPAAGKTAAFLEYITETNQKAVVASISRQLSRQSYNYYQHLGGKNSIIIDSDNKQENSSVSSSIHRVMTDDNKPDVIFLTHTSLLQHCDFELFKGYHLYIDEVPDMVSLDMMKLTFNTYQVLDFCECIDGEPNKTYNLVLDEDRREKLTEMAMDGFRQNDEIAEKLLPIYKSLLFGHPVRFRYDNDSNVSQFYYISDLSNQNWNVFTGITISCANFDQTFTGYVLRHWNGWSFKDSHLHSRLRFEKYKNTERIEIQVMCNQPWSRCVADKSLGETSVYNTIHQRIEELYPRADYLYTTNSFRSRMNGHQIQYNPHGLNMYSGSQNIVALFSYNPQPWQIPILSELATMQNLSENELVDAFVVSKYLEPIFQLCTRGDIRNVNSDKKITLFVPDDRAAQYLKTNYLHKATIRHDYVAKVDVIVKPTKEYNWKSRGISAVLEMTPKERRAFYYHCSKKGIKASQLDPNNPKQLYEAKLWLDDYRNK